MNPSTPPDAGCPVVPRRDVRHGVPIYWMDEAPDLTVALMFRVGRADETPLTCGITHLAEHLALFGFGVKQAFVFNGFVDGYRVVFHATGSPEQACEFMSRLCEAITNLPIERFDAERRVLRAESASRSFGPVDNMKWIRFGSRAHGLTTMHEHILHASDPEPVRAWVRERFTAENAAAWISGPIPDALSFEALPHGRRIPCPEPVAIADLRTPAFLPNQSGGVAISFVADRERWISIPLQIAAERLIERLRYQEGLTYSVSYDFHPITAHLGHALLWTSCLDEYGGEVAKGLLSVLDELGEKGPTAEELRIVGENIAKAWLRPEAGPGLLDSCAYNELIGYAAKGPAQLLEEFQLMTPESCAAAVRGVLETSIISLPPGCAKPDDRFHPYPLSSRLIVNGRRFKSVSQRFPWSKKAPELLIGKDGVSLAQPDGTVITVLFAACGGVVEANNIVRLIGDDGFNIWIRSEDWTDGRRAVNLVYELVPRDRVLKIVA